MTQEEEKSQNESTQRVNTLDEKQMFDILRPILWGSDRLKKEQLCLVGFLVFDESELESSNTECDIKVKERICQLGSYSELSFMERLQHLQKTRVLSEVFFLEDSQVERALQALEEERENNEWVMLSESVEQDTEYQKEGEISPISIEQLKKNQRESEL
jgi:hypothetical protein